MKLNRKQAAAFGIDVPSAKRQPLPEDKEASRRQKEHDRRLFYEACRAHGLPQPIDEFEFAAELGRHWRFDWLFDGWLALEIQGGLYVNGRHTNGAALEDEHEKLNAAAMLGYVVIFCQPKDVATGAAFALVKKVLDSKAEMG